MLSLVIPFAVNVSQSKPYLPQQVRAEKPPKTPAKSFFCACFKPQEEQDDLKQHKIAWTNPVQPSPTLISASKDSQTRVDDFELKSREPSVVIANYVLSPSSKLLKPSDKQIKLEQQKIIYAIILSKEQLKDFISQMHVLNESDNNAALRELDYIAGLCRNFVWYPDHFAFLRRIKLYSVPPLTDFLKAIHCAGVAQKGTSASVAEFKQAIINEILNICDLCRNHRLCLREEKKSKKQKTKIKTNHQAFTHVMPNSILHPNSRRDISKGINEATRYRLGLPSNRSNLDRKPYPPNKEKKLKPIKEIKGGL